MNNPVTENRFDLQIKTLQNAPRDPDKLRECLKQSRDSDVLSYNRYSKSKGDDERGIIPHSRALAHCFGHPTTLPFAQ
jgi:hypothetical protein